MKRKKLSVFVVALLLLMSIGTQTSQMAQGMPEQQPMLDVTNAFNQGQGIETVQPITNPTPTAEDIVRPPITVDPVSEITPKANIRVSRSSDDPSWAQSESRGEIIASFDDSVIMRVGDIGLSDMNLQIGKQSPFVRASPDGLVRLYDDKRFIEVAIKLSSDASLEKVKQVVVSMNGKIVKYVDIIDTLVVVIPLSGIDAAMETLNSLREVEYAEPSYYFKALYTPNDPMWADQWGPQIVGMEFAWDYELGSTDIVVAVIDTGIDYTHPDLDNYLPIGYDWVNNDPDPMDDHGHGTHVAGTIGATINNALGIAGMANVSFFAEKFLDAGGFGSDVDAAAAILHAVSAGADILSNSWGGYGFSQVLADAVANATSQGVIVVAAAGNEATDQPLYPAALPGVIAVTATDPFDQPASFTNFGDWVDIAAPGVSILSTVPWGYEYFSGTSMATPHVSGLLALLKSAFPTYSSSQLEQLLFSSALDLGAPGFDPYYGWGRIDASTAIFGLQDHNLKASVIVPRTIPGDLPSTVIARVTNAGLLNETSVFLSLYVNDSLVSNATIPMLGSGEFYDLSYDFFPPSFGAYNFTVVVAPVPGEIITEDNIAQALVEAVPQQIHPEVGDVLGYLPVGSTYPYSVKWVVSGMISPTEYILDLYLFDNTLYTDILAETITVNPYTREVSAIWDLFPYWISPNVSIGDPVDLFAYNDGSVVVGEDVIDYYGELIPVWIVDDGAELVYFSKSDGVLMAIRDYEGNPIFYDMAFTTVLPNNIEFHNVRVSFLGPTIPILGQAVDLVFFVQNTGEFFENTTATLIANNETLVAQTFFLDVGDYTVVHAYYNVTSPGYYWFALFADIVPGENYWDDNQIFKEFQVSEPNNYIMTMTGFAWFDAYANGVSLGIIGDDAYAALELPFSFEFYGVSFDTLYVGSNGWMSFYDQDPWEFWTPSFPTNEFPFTIAPFWNDLISYDNIYAWATPDFIVIEYYQMEYLFGGIAGTFEVVLFPDGSILFQYLSMGADNFSTKGLNYGFDLSFYNVILADLSYVSEVAYLFTLPSGNDLQAILDVPDRLNPGSSTIIYATVTNNGPSTQQGVEIQLFINDQIVSSMYADELVTGESLTLGFYWTPQELGFYDISAFALPIDGDPVPFNNVDTKVVFVGKVTKVTDFEGSLKGWHFDGLWHVVDDSLPYGESHSPTHSAYYGIDETGNYDTGDRNYGTLLSPFYQLGDDVFVLNFWSWYETEPGNYFDVKQVYVVFANGSMELIGNVDGEMNSWQEFYMDISAYRGMLVRFAFFFDTVDEIFNNFRGWYVDDIKIYGTATKKLVHDLEASVEVQDMGTYYKIIGTITNIGDFEERNVRATIYLNGEMVSLGIISKLGIDKSASLVYYWYGFTEGTHNATLAIKERTNEFRTDNNVATLIFSVFEPTPVTITVFDALTGAPIFNALVELYSNSSDYTGWTNETGSITFLVKPDFYYGAVFADGYNTLYFDFVAEPDLPLYFSYPLTPISKQEATIVFQVYNAFNASPIEGAQITLWGNGTTFMGYTNSTGGITFVVPTGEYDIAVEATGYQPFYTWGLFDMPVEYFIEAWLVPEPAGEATLSFMVYDNSTGLTIEGATIVIAGTAYYEEGITDFNGTYETVVPLDNYWINVQKDGYYYTTFSLVVDVPGDVISIYIGLIPFGSTSTLEIHVFEAATGMPIENAYVSVVSLVANVTSNGVTDTNGTVVFELPAGISYIVDVQADPYFPEYDLVALPENQTTVYEFYLDQVVPVSISILEPTTGAAINGGLVYVAYDATAAEHLSTIEIWVNGAFVAYADYYGSMELFAPVFNEGQNTITLVGYWSNGYIASANVTINSVGVTPFFNVNIGDTITWFFTWYSELWGMYFNQTLNFNFTSMVDANHVSVFVMDTRMNEQGDYFYDEYTLIVDLRNGYVSDGPWAMLQFFPFASIAMSDGVVDIGDKAPLQDWGLVFTVVGTATWNGVTVWDLRSGSNSTVYASPVSPLFVHYESGTIYSVGDLIYTNIPLSSPKTTTSTIAAGTNTGAQAAAQSGSSANQLTSLINNNQLVNSASGEQGSIKSSSINDESNAFAVLLILAIGLVGFATSAAFGYAKKRVP